MRVLGELLDGYYSNFERAGRDIMFRDLHINFPDLDL